MMLFSAFFILMAVAYVSAHDCTETVGKCPEVSVDKDFQLSQLVGTLHLVGTSFHNDDHHHNDTCTKYQLELNGDKLTGTKSFNYGVNGQSASEPGSVTLKAPGLLVFNFNEPEHEGAADKHQVLLHDGDFVVLYGCTQQHHEDSHCLDILVLCKRKQVPKESLDKVINQLQGHGVNIKTLYTDQQQGC